MRTTPILERIDRDDDFQFVEVEVEPDPRGHPRPEVKEEVLLFLLHAQGGCRVCTRICGSCPWIVGLHVEGLHPNDE